MSQKRLNISIVGTGYVGLTTAALLSYIGYKVYTVDIDKKKIDTIKTGKSYFYEEGLDFFVSNAIEKGNLIPTTSYEEAIPESDIVFSCVGTPDKEDGSPNLEYIYSAIKSTVELAKSGVTIVQKSTVPVGTGNDLKKYIQKIKPDLDFSYVSNPEFLAESSAVYDTLFFDRLVLGSDEPEAVKIVANVFKDLDKFAKDFDEDRYAAYANTYKGKDVKELKKIPFEDKLVSTTLSSAELIKVTANAFLALKISFANSIAKLCDQTGADVNQVMDGVGKDVRIGRSFLYAGLGWGGGCFPKDVSGLISVAEENGVKMPIMNAAVEVNLEMVDYVVQKIEKLGIKPGSKIAVLGLSFKPGTSDCRKSQSIRLANELIKKGYSVQAYDPAGMEEAKPALSKDVTLKNNIEECVDGVDVVILATEWKEFIEYDWQKAAGRGIVFVDARNRMNPEYIIPLGYIYCCVGKS